jgi:hypothetical protein
MDYLTGGVDQKNDLLALAEAPVSLGGGVDNGGGERVHSSAR